MKTEELSQFILPLERYEELLKKEKEAKVPRAHTVLRIGSGIYGYTWDRVSTDDEATAKIAELAKERGDELDSLRAMNIFQFLKWKYK